jgi:hypothetical protein
MVGRSDGVRDRESILCRDGKNDRGSDVGVMEGFLKGMAEVVM